MVENIKTCIAQPAVDYSSVDIYAPIKTFSISITITPNATTVQIVTPNPNRLIIAHSLVVLSLHRQNFISLGVESTDIILLHTRDTDA